MTTIQLNTTDPYHIVYKGQKGALVNEDTVNTVLVGSEQGVLYGTDPDTFLIGPLNAVICDGTQDYWAIAITGSPQVQFMPGITQWAVSPIQILGLALADEIAQAIATTGVSFLAAPQLLYNQQTIQPGTPGPLGASVIAADYGSSSDLIAIQTWNGNVNRNAKCGKVFYGTISSFPSALDNKTSPYVTLGMTCYLCVKPAFNPPNATDKHNLVNGLTTLKAAGLNAVVIPWQELGRPSGMTPALFTAMLQYYANTDGNGAGIRSVYPLAICYDSAIGCGTAAASWFPGSGNAFVDIIGQDLYASSYLGANALRFDQPGGSMSVADANNLPFGVFETGSVAGFDPTPGNSQVTGQYMPYILNTMQARIVSSKTNDAVMWFNTEQGAVAGANTIVSGDFRIPSLQNWFDTLSQGGGGGAGLVLNAGQGKDVTPITPSPGAGLANADFLSYDVTLNLTTSTGSTNPFVTVLLSWFNTDSATAAAVHTVAWQVPCGTAGTTGTVITGRGPMRASLMKVRVVNRDSVSVVVNNIQVNGTGRLVDRDDWYWDAVNSLGVPGFTLPGGASECNSLGSINNINVPAGTAVAYLLSMFAGDVYCRMETDAAVNLMSVQLAAQPTSQFGTGSMFNQYISNPNTINELEETLIFPRGPVLVTFNNHDTVAHHVNAQFNNFD
jgi:hypothetical protein